jgi:hypothetical protein
MDGYKILRTKKEEKVPDEDTFSLLLQGKRVVLLLEDLNDYVDRELDLREFGEWLGRHASSWVVTSTCRDGPELRAVEGGGRQEPQTSLTPGTTRGAHWAI